MAGPPRELAGANEATGVFGGFVEAPPPSPPWSNYQAGCWNVVPEVEGRCPTTSPADGGIWAAVRAGSGEGAVFNDDVDPNSIDNGAGVSWDDHLNNALKPGEHASYTIISRAQTPNGLTVAPGSQTRTVGQTASVLVTAADNTGAPYANRPIVYSIGEANPKPGSVLTNSAGVATISYVGTASGADTMQVFLDLASSGVKASRDPSATAQVTWLAAAAAAASANSRYRLRSIHVDSHGMLTIVLVPVQNGTATVQVRSRRQRSPARPWPPPSACAANARRSRSAADAGRVRPSRAGPRRAAKPAWRCGLPSGPPVESSARWREARTFNSRRR